MNNVAHVQPNASLEDTFFVLLVSPWVAPLRAEPLDPGLACVATLFVVCCLRRNPAEWPFSRGRRRGQKR